MRLPFLLRAVLTALWLTVSLNACAQDVAFRTSMVKRFLSLGTASINGAYYPLGAALSRLFNSHLKDVVAIAEPTGGSVTNIGYLRSGDLALALVQSDVAYAAFHGRGPFDKRPFKELRVLASLYSEVIQVVVMKDSPIVTLADLRGKRLALGERGSGTELNSRLLISTLGLNSGEFVPCYDSFTKATAALHDGYVDALFFTGGIGAEGLKLLAKRSPVRFIPLGKSVRDSILSAHPYWQEEIIPAGTYQNQTEEITTIGLRALLTAREDFDAGLAERMLELLFQNVPYVASLSKPAEAIRLQDALKGIEGDMIHDGARRFYVRKNIIPR